MTTLTNSTVTTLEEVLAAAHELQVPIGEIIEANPGISMISDRELQDILDKHKELVDLKYLDSLHWAIGRLEPRPGCYQKQQTIIEWHIDRIIEPVLADPVLGQDPEEVFKMFTHSPLMSTAERKTSRRLNDLIESLLDVEKPYAELKKLHDMIPRTNKDLKEKSSALLRKKLQQMGEETDDFVVLKWIIGDEAGMRLPKEDKHTIVMKMVGLRPEEWFCKEMLEFCEKHSMSDTIFSIHSKLIPLSTDQEYLWSVVGLGKDRSSSHAARRTRREALDRIIAITDLNGLHSALIAILGDGTEHEYMEVAIVTRLEKFLGETNDVPTIKLIRQIASMRAQGSLYGLRIKAVRKLCILRVKAEA